MSGKFQPPPTTMQRFDADTDTDSHDDVRGSFDGTEAKDTRKRSSSRTERTSIRMERSLSRMERKRDTTGEGKNLKSAKNKIVDSSENSDSEEASEEHRAAPSGTRAPGGYDPNSFGDLRVSPEVDNLFQHILRYTPQKMEIEYRLQPFVPEYVPAVGDIDAFLKVAAPHRMPGGAEMPSGLAETIQLFGLTVLDEPATQQSDSALLHLQLRARSKTSSDRSTLVTKKIEDAERNPKALEQWIRDVSELHLSKPAPNVTYATRMPDLETLMEEWPEAVETALNDVRFVPHTMDCSLVQYTDLMCAMFDIPVVEDTLNARLQALHVLFTLYDAVKNSQLYAERQKEKNVTEN